MLVVERSRRAELLLLSVLALAPAAAPAQTGEPVVVKLNDAVGDSLDRAERDSFHLFPNTTGFRDAVILALPGPEFYAEVTLDEADTTAQVYYRIQPGQLERIRALIDNREQVMAQLQSDSSSARALASFWHSIEDSPLRNMTSEPPVAPEAPPPPTEPVTIENRYVFTLLGMTLGSGAGGCVGTRVAFKQVGSTGGCISLPIYAVNHPLFWSTACGLTTLGSVAGYAVGDRLDHKTASPTTLPDEGAGWRTGCAIGAAIPGLALGTVFAVLAIDSQGQIENDPWRLTALPLALTGLCIAVEVTTIGYRIGRAIDRRNAEKAEAKRRAPGH